MVQACAAKFVRRGGAGGEGCVGFDVKILAVARVVLQVGAGGGLMRGA